MDLWRIYKYVPRSVKKQVRMETYLTNSNRSFLLAKINRENITCLPYTYMENICKKLNGIVAELGRPVLV